MSRHLPLKVTFEPELDKISVEEDATNSPSMHDQGESVDPKNSLQMPKKQVEEEKEEEEDPLVVQTCIRRVNGPKETF